MADGTAPAIEIREAVSADIPRLIELNLSALARMLDEARALPGTNCSPLPTPADVQDDFIEAIGDENFTVLIATIEGEFAGFIMGVIEEHGDELVRSPYLTIYNVATVEQYQGRGVATALMAHIEQAAAKRDIPSLELLVWASNPGARRLYEKLGYHVLEHRMAKRLDQS